MYCGSATGGTQANDDCEQDVRMVRKCILITKLL